VGCSHDAKRLVSGPHEVVDEGESGRFTALEAHWDRIEGCYNLLTAR